MNEHLFDQVAYAGLTPSEAFAELYEKNRSAKVNLLWCRLGYASGVKPSLDMVKSDVRCILTSDKLEVLTYQDEPFLWFDHAEIDKDERFLTIKQNYGYKKTAFEEAVQTEPNEF